MSTRSGSGTTAKQLMQVASKSSNDEAASRVPRGKKLESGEALSWAAKMELKRKRAALGFPSTGLV